LKIQAGYADTAGGLTGTPNITVGSITGSSAALGGATYYGSSNPLAIKSNSNTNLEIQMGGESNQGGITFRTGGYLSFVMTGNTTGGGYGWQFQDNQADTAGTTFFRVTYSAGTGSFRGDVIAYSSDRRLKTKTGSIEDPLNKLKMLHGFTYVHNELANKNGFKDTTEHVGVSAQDVQSVLPQAVKLAPFDTKDGKTSISGENYLTVQYERIVPLLIEALKEESRKREELENIVRSLDARIKILEQR
jgi:hypothetical protein